MKKNFLNSINYFRGFAIAIIVFGHSYGLSNLDVITLTDKFFFSLIKHGSVYFVFISGFLFHHIFFRKYSSFDYKNYMSKKLKNVFLPYCCISIIPIIFRVFYLEDRDYMADWASGNKILSVFWYLVTGRIFVGYWYIPTAMILFTLSPLIIWWMKSKYFIQTIMFLLGISLIIHRPLLNLNPIHSTIYFLPVYGLGIYASVNKQYIYKYMENKKIIFLGLILLLALVQAIFWDHPGSLQRSTWFLEISTVSVDMIDINLIQKILACFLMMSWLNSYEETKVKLLEQLAQTSFAIYFIHPILMSIGRWLVFNLDLSYQGNFLIFLFVFSLLLFGSMGIAFIIKLIFKKKSRYLIGC